ncbi:NUDIX domain-containing protein [Longispora sp. NPDC051575]|uniref:NUDIX hydrolase n=1 Tax=Longispora sp. NPDC051575 TaxID=3154943 RepID=UPI00342E8CDC
MVFGMMARMEKRQRVSAYGVVVRDGRVLLVPIARTEVSGEVGLWILPGGGVEHGEHPEEAVVRELAEETGYAVRVDGLSHVGSDHRRLELPGLSVDWHCVYLVYLVAVTGGQPRAELDGTMGTPTWFDLEDLPVMHSTSRTMLDRVVAGG